MAGAIGLCVPMDFNRQQCYNKPVILIEIPAGCARCAQKQAERATSLKQTSRIPRKKGREYVYWLVGLTAAAVLIFWLSWLFPRTSDDWLREVVGNQIHSPKEMLDIVWAKWCSSNSRVMGNILAYSAACRPVLRAVLRGAFLFGAALMTSRVIGFTTVSGFLLTTACVLAVPADMFAQIYPWAAGFFNYVPPVVILFVCLRLMDGVFDGNAVSDHPIRIAVLFVLGFCGQLFMENNTLYAVWAGFVLLLWYGVKQKRLSRSILSFWAGTILGAAALFLSPSYLKITQEDNAYSLGVRDLWAKIQENQAIILKFTVTQCPVIFGSLSVLALLLFVRKRRTAADWILAAGIALTGLLLLNQYSGLVSFLLLPEQDPVLPLVWLLLIGLAGLAWVSEKGLRSRTIFFWVSAIVAAVPLLVVSPIGSRCLYLSYLCLIVTAGLMLRDLRLRWVSGTGGLLLSAALAVCVLAYDLHIFTQIHTVDIARTAQIERAMAAHEAAVTIPDYPHEEYLWAPRVSMEYWYYYEEPGDFHIIFEGQE